MDATFASVIRDSYSPAQIFNVDGLVAVVTGGGTGEYLLLLHERLRLITLLGIGLIMAKALERNGATVYIVGRRLNVLEEAALLHSVSSLSRSYLPLYLTDRQQFDKIIPVQGDVTDRASLLSVVETIKTRHGYVDLLVNNAGIAKNLFSHPLPSPRDGHMECPPSPPDLPDSGPSIPSIKSFQSALWNTGSPEDFAQVFATNVTAPYYTTVAFLDLLHQGNIRQQLHTDAFPGSFSRPPYHSSQVLTVSSSGAFRFDAKMYVIPLVHPNPFSLETDFQCLIL